MTNIARFLHILPTYFTAFYTSETAKYKKQRKNLAYRTSWTFDNYLIANMCVYVCLRPSTVKASSVWIWNSQGQINNVLPGPFIATLEWSIELFLLAALSCSHTRSGQNHNLISFMCTSLSEYEGFSQYYQASPSVPATSWDDLLSASALTKGVTV